MKHLIVGNGDYAKMLLKYIQNNTCNNVVGFTVDSNIITDKYIYDLPIIESEKMNDFFDPSEYSLYMGIGYRNMNQIKEEVFNQFKKLGYSFENYIHPTAIIGKDVQMGEANNIFEGVIIQEGVRIGDANLIYGGALIAHETIVGDYNSISVKSCVAGCVVIENNCFLGANSTIRDHIKVSSYTLVGAGTYVDRSTNKYEVIVTPKAVTLKERNSLEFI